jgi:flagellar capping protein FliD
MEAMREKWTDERLDDLAKRMDRGFDRVDSDLRDMKAETSARFDRLDARFDSMQRMMLGAYVTAVLGFIFTQL